MKFSRSTYIKAAAAVLAVAAVGAAQARDNINWSVGIGVPGVTIGATNGRYYAPPPVYYSPAPIYYSQPSYVYPSSYYVEPAPVYVAPAPIYYSRPYYGPYYGHRHHRHRH